MNIDRDTALLIAKGADPANYFEKAPKKVQGRDSYICPCGNGSGKDGTGFHEDPARPGKYHCFVCGTDGDILDFIGKQQNLTGGDLFRYVYEREGITAGSPLRVEEIDKTPENEPIKPLRELTTYQQAISEVLPYLKDRGISEDTARRFKLGYCPDIYFKDGYSAALIIPTSDHSYVARNLAPDAKQRYTASKGERYPFNIGVLDQLKPSDHLYITEGEIDALSIIELGHNAIGLAGANNMLYDKLKQIEDKPRILISMDNDDAGRKKSAQLAEDLTALGIDNNIIDLTGGYNDPNDLLRYNRAELQRILNLGVELVQEQRSKEHQKTSAGANIDQFLEAVQDGVYIPVSTTGYHHLDEALGGGLYWGLYVLGAISSLGKTTYLLQMMDQIAEQGQDALIFSLEMSRHELIAKSISRETFKHTQANKLDRSNAKDSRDITNKLRQEDFDATDRKVLQQGIENYRAYANNLYITEGQGDITVKQIRKAISDHIEITGKRPVVLIDYLQLIAPINDRWSERQNMDHAISNLRIIARDLMVPIIAVSSVSRGNYGNQEASISSFKESGGIEYGADTALILQFTKRVNDGKKDPKKHELDKHERNEKRKTPREVEVVIVKNRNGITGDTINYLYYPKYNHFVEKIPAFDIKRDDIVKRV